MAANEKYDDLGLDGLESETLLHDEDTLSGIDDLDNFDLDSDLDFNLDDVMSDDETASADDLDNLDKLDYSGAESDDAAVSDYDAPIESDMSENDIVDYPDAIDTTGEPTEAGEELSDDDLDLSLETNIDDDSYSAVTPDISDDDIAEFDSSDYDDESLSQDDDDDDEDDDDAYGVDLKIGPVTIAFTQVIEPEESVAADDLPADDDFGDFGDADLGADETDEFDTEDDNLDNADTDLADDLENIDGLSDEDSLTETEEADDNENYDITSDDDLEFDVEQDDALSDIDIDDVLEKNHDDGDQMLNIPMPHEDELVVDEEQNAFLSGEAEDVMPELTVSDSVDSNIADEITDFDETVEDLNSIGSSDSNLISDDDLNALEDSMPESVETEESDENLSEATLVGNVIVDEALAETIDNDENDDDRITLDGDEDLGIELENGESDDNADMNLDEDLPDTLDDGISDADMTEEISDESDVITDEIPEMSEEMSEMSNDDLADTEIGSLDDLDVDSIPAPATFDDDDDDETIGLSGDELDNILVDADMSETEQEPAEIDELDIPPTEEELAESINIPDDPSFENDDEFMSDEELAASVSIPGEVSADNEELSDITDESGIVAEQSEESAVDNNIMTNGDLDLYENVDENGSIIADDDTKMIDNGVEELSEHTIVVPAAADDTLAENEDSQTDIDADIDNLETDTIEKSDADFGLDDSADTEEESETIDLSSFEADLEPTDDFADIGDIGMDETVEDTVAEESDASIEDDDDDTKIDISEDETNQIYDSLQNEENQSEGDTELKQDMKNVLTCLDSLLGALPEEKIKEFAESKEFEAYRRLFEQLDIKH